MNWRSLRFPLALGAVIFVTGCMVGPDFKAPELNAPDRYTATPLPAATAGSIEAGGAAQQFLFAADLAEEWWTLFRSPELDRLIKQGLEGSPSLAAAQAALRKAEEDLRATQGGLLLPDINADLQAARKRSSGSIEQGDSKLFTLYNTSINISYTLDLFGGARRQVEALKAQVDYQRYQYEAAYLTLTGNIVTTAIQEAALKAQYAAAQGILAAQQKQIAVVKRQVEVGAGSPASLLAQQAELAGTKASLPPIEKQIEFARHALAALTGQWPGQGGLPEFNLDALQLPESLPVSLPSELARRRPDVRASEELLHQACAQVGVATANLYPQITLNGGYGFQAVGSNVLFSGESVAWSLGAGLLQPIFRGGELTAKRRGAIAAYDQAAAGYRQTVLKAFQNVADALRALEADARTLQAQTEAETAAKKSLTLIERQFELGAVNYLSLLIAQRDYQKTQINLIAARAQRYADTAALFQALGGGWWQRQSASETKAKPADK